ncbi:anti-repressor SinI family protein [Microbacteriaceae bacterium 4G12]
MCDKEIMELDPEWIQLISEALNNGITEEQIRGFLLSKTYN